jgi:hypothetical protein
MIAATNSRDRVTFRHRVINFGIHFIDVGECVINGGVAGCAQH